MPRPSPSFNRQRRDRQGRFVRSFGGETNGSTTGRQAASTSHRTRRRSWLPRFSLRALFLAVAGFCGLLALATAVDGVWMVVVVWALLMVAAHVGGNVSGRKRYGGVREMDEGPAFISATIIHAPSTHLREKVEIGRKLVAWTAASAAVGCLLGLIYLVFGLNQTPPLLGLLIGAFSAAVIGGLLGFLAGSFVNVFRHAFRQASGKSAPPEAGLESEAAL